MLCIRHCQGVFATNCAYSRCMKHISILVPYTAVPAAIVDPRYMFSAVNAFRQASQHGPSFLVELVASTREVSLLDGSFVVRSDKLISEITHTDLIIVPAIGGDLREALELNSIYRPWLIQQYKNGAEIASLCIGAFLLADTGLLDGSTCSTHWLYADEFRSMFPKVKLSPDRLITESAGLYTSGGASSYWNLLLYLVEKYTDRPTAIMASKFFLLDMGRHSQAMFSIFKGQRDHDDPIVQSAQSIIERQYREKLSVQQIADQVHVGRRTFERRFRNATDNTVGEYQQRVRTEVAKHLLENGRRTVSEVMYEVGYTDAKAFRDIFKKHTGLSPVEYRKRYNPA